MSEFHRQNPEAPQHILAIDFPKLPFCPLTNFTDTPGTVLPRLGYWLMHIGMLHL